MVRLFELAPPGTEHLLRCDTTSGDIVIDFAAASGWTDKLQRIKHHIGTGKVTLTPNGVEKIERATTVVMLLGESAEVQSDGTNLLVW